MLYAVKVMFFLHYFGSEPIKRVSFDSILLQYHNIHFSLCYSKVLYDINHLSKSIHS